MRKLVLVCLVAAVAAAPALAGEAKSPRAGWNFKFTDFVIGAWWGPDATDAELRIYKEAGFNVVMAGRYMQLDGYGDAAKGVQELDLAQKHGLGVMFDTYTMNARPWGGKAGQVDGHRTHHAASLIELKWLYKVVGKHPALIGFMIGDDKSALTPRLIDCTNFLRKTAPHLMPWICQNVGNPQSLAGHGNPIYNVQIYPTLYRWRLPAGELARRYCAAFAKMRRECEALDLILWPMFNVTRYKRDAKSGFANLTSDSLARFPAYASLAYGAQGIWYFTYNGGALQAKGTYKTAREVRRALTPLYPIAKRANLRIAAWGPRLLGRKASGLFGNAWAGDEWPFDEADKATVPPEALASPAPGKLVEAMSRDLLVGILTKPKAQPLAMVVDCRVSKEFGNLPSRQVHVRFCKAVEAVRILEGKAAAEVKGQLATLKLEPGGGQLLELCGDKLGPLTSAASIYGAAPGRKAPLRPRPVSAADLAAIQAAKLRIDVFGSDSRPPHDRKQVVLNGHTLGPVPGNNRDAWDRKVVDLKADQLRRVKPVNQVTLTGARADAWKLRNVTLAVQLADGTWVKTHTHKTTYASKKWAHFEGTPIPEDGVVGPMELKFDSGR